MQRFRLGAFERRPWGWMFTFVHIPWGWIKIIHVKSGEATSDQRHKTRSELHVRIAPSPRLTVVSPGVWHRMEGGLYVECAGGKLVVESDIERRADRYGRV